MHYSFTYIFRIAQLFTLLFMLAYSLPSIAQILQSAPATRLAPISEYYWHQTYYNPAFAGETSQPKFALNSRFGSYNNRKPYGFTAIWQGAVPALRGGLALSSQYYDFNEAATSSTGTSYDTQKRIFVISAAYSYIFEVGELSTIKFGASAGLLHFKNDYVSGGGINGQVPVTGLNESFFKPAINLGFLFTIKRFYTGIAVNYINEPEFSFYQGSGAGSNTFKANAYVSAGIDIPLANELLYIQPSLMLNSMAQASGFANGNNAPFLDVNLRCSYKNIAYVGASYHVNNAPYFLSISAGGRFAELYQLSLNYALANGGARATKLEATLAIFFNNNDDE